MRAAQAEIHAPAQIRHGPVHAISDGPEPGVVERAVGVRAALDRMSLIEMGVNVDQHWPHLPAAEVDAWGAIVTLSVRCLNACERAALDQESRLDDTFTA